MNDKKNKTRALRIAIIHTSNHKPEDLERALAPHNINIVTCAELSHQALCEINTDSTDAILVDLDENAEQELDVLEALLEQSTLPLLFNDNATTEFNISISSPDWSNKLVNKLHRLVEKSAKQAEEPPAGKIEPLPISSPAVPQTPEVKDRAGAKSIWVLGASLGGPLAVKEFLSFLPAKQPVAFVLAQHIGESHIDLLGEQLNRATELDVMTAKPGHTIKNNEVILAPIEQRIVIDKNGEISLHPLETDSIYTPSIDDVMSDIAQTFNAETGAIIFSGMGNDGEKGCLVVKEHGGRIWAQEPESCVISSMPDCARRTGFVEFSGTPEQLAYRLIRQFA